LCKPSKLAKNPKKYSKNLTMKQLKNMKKQILKELTAEINKQDLLLLLLLKHNRNRLVFVKIFKWVPKRIKSSHYQQDKSANKMTQ
jgi:hypothetical protein